MRLPRLLGSAIALALLASGVLAVPSSAATLPPFQSSVQRIDDELRERMVRSWRPGCPVPLRKLRYVTVSFAGFRGNARQGELIHRAQVAAVVSVFERLTTSGSRFGGCGWSTTTSATTTPRWPRTPPRRSTAAAGATGPRGQNTPTGRAIGVNPVQNPKVYRGVADPPASEKYIDRSPLRTGMVTRGVRRALAAIGWEWGGDWTAVKDYQHFSATGR